MPLKTKKKSRMTVKGKKPVKSLGSRSSKNSSGFLASPKFSKITASIFVLFFAAIGSYLLFHSRAATLPVLGIHTGPRDVAGVDNFANWLKSPTPYGIDYLDHTKTWDVAFNDINWLLDPWSTWVKTMPGRRLVLGVPMLVDNSAGQLTQGASGANDQYFKNLAQNMVNHGLGNSIIRLGWEANGNWYAWSAGTDPTGWKAYYRHIVGVMRSVPGQNFQFDLTRANGPASTNLSFDAMYPGDDVVDYMGMDAYDVKWQDSTSAPDVRWNFLLTQQYGLNAHRDFANAHNKPMSFPEWGLYKTGDQQGGGGDNPYYIDKMADWFTTNNVAYQAYFNADWGGGVLSNFPNAQSRYKARFGSTSTGPVITTVNDNTIGTGINQFEYSGTWTPEAGYSFYYQSDDRYSGTAGSTYKIRFNGNKISLYGATGTNGGLAMVSVDGGPETSVDFYSSTRNNQAVVFASPMLTDSAHTLTLRVTGTKNISSSGPYVSVDRADISSGGTISSDTTSPAQPTNLTATVQSSSQINLSWTVSTDNVGVTGYDIYRNSVKIATAATNSYSDTALTATTTYSYYIIAKDAASNSSPASSTASATTPAPAPIMTDIIPPAVSYTSPTNGATLIGTSTYIKATATDNVKVTKMEVWIDGTRKASNTSATSLAYTWSSKKVASGTHTITVKAYDAAGNISQSSITVYK